MRIVAIDYRPIVRTLIFKNSRLEPSVLFQIAIAVKMVVGQVQVNSDLRSEALDPFELEARYLDYRYVVIAADSVDKRSAEVYISGHQITYPILFDCGQVAYSYLRVVQFDLPQVFLIDAKGMVQHHYEYGPMTRDIFEGDGLSTEIDRLLAATATPRNASQKK